MVLYFIFCFINSCFNGNKLEDHLVSELFHEPDTGDQKAVSEATRKRKRPAVSANFENEIIGEDEEVEECEITRRQVEERQNEETGRVKEGSVKSIKGDMSKNVTPKKARKPTEWPKLM